MNANKLLGLCACFRLTVVLSTFSIALAVKGQSAYEPFQYFTLIGQGNPGITNENELPIGPNACAPTAVANGLGFLDQYEASLGVNTIFSSAMGDSGSVNGLATLMKTANNVVTYVTSPSGEVLEYRNFRNPPVAGGTITGPGGPYKVIGTTNNVGGTTAANMKEGLIKYLNQPLVNPAGNTPVYTYSQGSPSAGSLAAVLKADDGVEVCITWGKTNAQGQFVASGGAHALTLDSIDMATATSGKIGMVDPWGTSVGNSPSASATFVSANVTAITGGLYISGLFNGDGDTFGTGRLIGGDGIGGGGTVKTGLITFELVESVTEMAGLPSPLPFVTAGNVPVLPVPEPSTYFAGALLMIPLGVSSLRKLRAVRLVA